MTITVSPEDPSAPEAQALLNAFVDEVRHRYDVTPADVGFFDPAVVSAPKSAFLVARVEGRAVGCGALVPMEDDVVEIKRMFVLPQERGHGIAKKILDRLQSLAQEFDYDRIRLETSDPVDPRLGTRIGLSQHWDSPAAVASFKFSGRAGARLRQAYGAAGTRPPKVRRTLLAPRF